MYDYTIGEPGADAKFCHRLCLLTEAEKVGQANIESAKHAKLGFIIGLCALGIAIASAILSLIAILK